MLCENSSQLYIFWNSNQSMLIGFWGSDRTERSDGSDTVAYCSSIDSLTFLYFIRRFWHILRKFSRNAPTFEHWNGGIGIVISYTKKQSNEEILGPKTSTKIKVFSPNYVEMGLRQLIGSVIVITDKFSQLIVSVGTCFVDVW